MLQSKKTLYGILLSIYCIHFIMVGIPSPKFGFQASVSNLSLIRKPGKKRQKAKTMVHPEQFYAEDD